jgi:cysteine synthase
VEHPTIAGIYGVTVHQKWTSSRYKDEGYVFMIWDFRNPDRPQIHVRTWQPEYVDKSKGQKLNPNDVFTLGDFDL